MKDFSTEALVRIVEQQLVEWRRLPVKHPQQIASRDQVINAILELKARVLVAEGQIEERNTVIVNKSKELFTLEQALSKQEGIHTALRRQLINADDLIADLRTNLNTLDKANKVFAANTRKIDALLHNGKETNAQLGNLVEQIKIQHDNHEKFIALKEHTAAVRKAKGRRLRGLYTNRWKNTEAQE